MMWMKQKSICIALTIVWCLLPPPAHGAESEPKETASVSSAPNSRDTDLRTLLRDVGARMHKHFVLDPRAPQSIDLGGLERQDVTYPQLLAVPQIHGMVVVAGDGVWQVVPNTDARQTASPIVAPENIKTLDDEWVTTIVPVKGINAAQLVPILRPLIPQAGHLAALPERNALIIVDRSANVRRLVEVIEILEGLSPKAVEVPATKAP